MDKKIDIKAFEAFVSKAFKLDAEGVAGLYNEAGELTDFSPLSKADKERIKELSEEAQKQFNSGRKQGAEKLERALREKYDVESDLIGVDLFDHILQTEVEKVKGAAPEDITKHPEYLKALSEADKALRKKDKEWQEKFEAREVELRKQSLMGKLKETALVELETLNPLLPEDPAKAKKWREKYVEELYKGEYMEVGDKFVLAENGKPKLNEHGYQVEFKDHAKAIASDFFEFKAADDRSSPGNKDNDNKPKTAPKNQDEYVARMREAETPEERAEVTKSWVATQQKS